MERGDEREQRTATPAAAGAGRHVTSKRVRKRRSARTSAGPNARQNAALPSACATSNGSDVANTAPSFASVWSPE